MGKRNDQIDVASLIKEARERKGLTQIDLAAQLDCSNSTVSVLESEGERGHVAREGFRRALRMCRVLDLNPSKL